MVPMSIFEYNEEETLKAIRADEFEMGMQSGIEKGIEQSIGLMVESCAELGNAREDVSAKIREKFHLKEADVQKYMDKYWK